jgi:RHS repeat-associated protein
LRVDEYFTRTASSTTSTFLVDALGSTLGLVTANNGSIATSYTYQPFGATTTGGSANGNSYEFTGRENDGTGLYFSRARYYNPTFQRFVSQDPIDFTGGVNLYAYALNNPISLRDLFGLCGGVPTPDPQPNATPTGAPLPPGPPFDYTQFGDCLLSAGASPLIISPVVCGVSLVGCLQAEAPGLNVKSCQVAAAFCTATAATVAACAGGTALPEF